MANNKTQEKNNKNQKRDYVFAVGKRREAVARVRLYTSVKSDLVWKDLQVKKGDIIINQKPVAEYFGGEISRYKYTEPIRVANAQEKNYTFTIRVAGGGPSGQLEAVVAGIANALSAVDPEKYHSILRQKGFITRDARVRQRRKVGMGGKSRRKLQSPKR